MIIKAFKLNQYSLVHKNLVRNQLNIANNLLPAKVFEHLEHHVFIRTDRFDWAPRSAELRFSENGDGLFISYLGMQHANTAVDAIRLLVINTIHEHDLCGACVDFDVPHFSKKRFAELIHGYDSQFEFEPFLALQWKPEFQPFGIRFTWEL